ncbi:hypothetical protein INT47_010359 [Mucor saturninus]|uniref:Uncharacterized protein n=1 Tax=Mucor saturninus TaxID=64648 RepID=A0A8H7QFC4_9FUNG|nr:hypothetical protein INT47_010359 [Mucor saturninus]
MTNPNSIQKVKLLRASQKGLNRRLLKSIPDFTTHATTCDIPILPATTVDTVANLVLSNTTATASEDYDVDISEFWDFDVAGIDPNTMNMLTEKEIVEQEEEHDRYIDGEVLDIESEDDADSEEFQRARECQLEEVDDADEVMEGKLVFIFDDFIP